MTTTILTFAIYLAACYALGLYLVIRLRAGRRVSQRVHGKPRKTHAKPMLGEPGLDDADPASPSTGYKHAA
ncbi:MAG: hypothetical protein AAF288_13470 [Planctomycetota bacterium]